MGFFLKTVTMVMMMMMMVLVVVVVVVMMGLLGCLLRRSLGGKASTRAAAPWSCIEIFSVWIYPIKV